MKRYLSFFTASAAFWYITLRQLLFLVCFSVPEKEPIYAIGIVDKIIDRLVVIHSFKDMEAALDEDTVMLLEDRSVIGKIYETFGPVPQPYYSVRFNSDDEIKEKGIILGNLRIRCHYDSYADR